MNATPDRRRIPNHRRRAFTLVETVVGLCLAFVVIASAWSILGAGMRNERLVSYMAAAKGARLLRESLRRDLARLDHGQGADACRATETGFEIQITKPTKGEPSSGQPPVTQLIRRYSFVKGTKGLIHVLRNDRPLAGVLLTKLSFRLVGWRHLRWLEIELQATDPGMAKASGSIDLARAALHETGLLLNLPRGAQDPAYFDYSAWPTTTNAAD